MTSFFRRATQTSTPAPAAPAAPPPPAPSSPSSSPSRPRRPDDSPESDADEALLIEDILTARTYYDVLGLSGSRRRDPAQFEESEIRRLYLKRSRKIHPDRHGNSPRATEAFQRLAAAYETLRDPKKRRLYDLQGERGTFTASGEETFSAALGQLVEEFFSGNFDQILSVVELMRRTNPELNISQEAVHEFLSKLREYFLNSSKAWDACRNEIFRLMELQATLRELSYWDLTGRARVATHLARIIVQIPLRMRDAWENEGRTNSSGSDGESEASPSSGQSSKGSYLGGAFGNAFWVILGLVDRSCENVDWVLSSQPWTAIRGLTFSSAYQMGTQWFNGTRGRLTAW
ncbi:DnaJ domain-containing protein [Hyaloraphidium curvatum]|nr:DnaJ domain-containing protein [Hyaloraphidium curvatum]